MATVRWKDKPNIGTLVAADKLPITKNSDSDDYHVTPAEISAFVLTGRVIGTDIQAWSANLDGWSAEDPDDYSTTAEANALYQPLDADLTTWAGLTPSANFQALVTQTFAQIRGSLDLEAGTDFYSIAGADAAFLSPAEGDAAYQPLDSDLTAIAALTTTSFGRSVLELSNAAALADAADLGTGDSPQFTAVNIGHASDTTLSRAAAGEVAVEGNRLAKREPAVNAQTGTSYTLALTDAGGIVTMSNGSANELTIPTNASVAFPTRTIINVIMLGSGTTSITGDTGVTVNGVSAGSGDIQTQYQGVSLLKIAVNTWVVSGDIGTVA